MEASTAQMAQSQSPRTSWVSPHCDIDPSAKRRGSVFKLSAFSEGDGAQDSYDNDAEVLCHGVLLKKGHGVFGRWQERYFVLRPDMLEYYSVPTSQVATAAPRAGVLPEVLRHELGDTKGQFHMDQLARLSIVPAEASKETGTAAISSIQWEIALTARDGTVAFLRAQPLPAGAQDGTRPSILDWAAALRGMLPRIEALQSEVPEAAAATAHGDAGTQSAGVRKGPQTEAEVEAPRPAPAKAGKLLGLLAPAPAPAPDRAPAPTSERAPTPTPAAIPSSAPAPAVASTASKDTSRATERQNTEQDARVACSEAATAAAQAAKSARFRALEAINAVVARLRAQSAAGMDIAVQRSASEGRADRRQGSPWQQARLEPTVSISFSRIGAAARDEYLRALWLDADANEHIDISPNNSTTLSMPSSSPSSPSHQQQHHHHHQQHQHQHQHQHDMPPYRVTGFMVTDRAMRYGHRVRAAELAECTAIDDEAIISMVDHCLAGDRRAAGAQGTALATDTADDSANGDSDSDSDYEDTIGIRAQSGPCGLELLDLTGCSKITDTALLALARGIAAAQEVEGQRMRPMRQLRLGRINGLTQESLRALLRVVGSDLRELELGGCDCVSDDVVMAIAAQCGGEEAKSDATSDMDEQDPGNGGAFACDHEARGLRWLDLSCAVHMASGAPARGGGATAASRVAASAAAIATSPSRSASGSLLTRADQWSPQHSTGSWSPRPLTPPSPAHTGLGTAAMRATRAHGGISPGQTASLASMSLTDAGVAALVAPGACGASLRLLWLRGRPNLGDSAAIAIAAGCPLLELLDLSGAHELTAAGVDAVARGCRELRNFAIAGCTRVRGRAAAAALAQLGQQSVAHRLTTLDLGAVRGVSTTAMCAMLNRGDTNLPDPAYQDVADAAAAAKVLAKMAAFRVPGTTAPIPPPPLPAMPACLLQRLSLSGCTRVDDNAVRVVVAACTMMERLDLSGCSRITDAAIFALAFSPCWRGVALPSICARAGTLRSLRVHDCSLLTDAGFEILFWDDAPGVSMHARTSRASLDLFDLGRCKLLSDATLRAAAVHCGASLHHLDVREVRALTDKAIVDIAAYCPSLKTLSAQRCAKLSDASLLALSEGCPRLVAINMMGCRHISSSWAFQFVKENFACCNIRFME